jgi:transposase
LNLPVQRILCKDCGCIKQARLGFTDPRYSYTKAFEAYVIDLSRLMTIKDIADYLDISWDVIKDILKRNLKKKYGKVKLKKLEYMAIDEIAIKKGHKYLTLVMDLESGRVVFVGDGKWAEALEPFWKRLKHSKAKVRAVAMDMSPAYISAVTLNLPKAEIVFDHFHVIKMFNDLLSKYRRYLQRIAETKEQKEAFKGTRWILLKNPENLDDSRNEKEKLDKALELNQPLAAAYMMKEKMRFIWFQKDKLQAEKELNEWISEARVSGVSLLELFADTLETHRKGILAYYDYRISTGPLEGTNNKIKTMKRQAYGFRDMEFFKLKILAIHESKYALVG